MMKLTCDTVQPELKAYLDGMLPAILTYRVRRHLSNCANCRAELSEIERTGKELHDTMLTDAGAGSDILDPILRERILAAIPAAPVPLPNRARNAIRYRSTMTAGVCAAVLGVAIVISQRQQLGLARRQTAKTMHEVQAPEAADSDQSATTSVPGSSRATAGHSSYLAGPTAAPALPRSVMGHTKSAAIDGKKHEFAAQASPNQKVSADNPAVATAARSQAASASVPTSSDNARALDATGTRYRFTANNLAAGEKVVRQAVQEFKGSVIRKSLNAAPDTVEFEVSVPTSQKEKELLSRILTLSAGQLHAVTSVSGGAGRASGSHPSYFYDGYKKIAYNVIVIELVRAP